MPKLVNLKRTPSEREDGNILAPSQKAFFPMGLHVSSPEIEKLSLSDAQIGDEYVLMATVRVTSISSDEQADGDKNSSVGFDITEAAFAKEGRSPESKLFKDQS